MKHQLLPPALRHLIPKAWKALSGWFRLNTLTPGWMPQRGRHPLVGYLLALALDVFTVSLAFLALPLRPHVEIPGGVLVFLLILFLGLNWGAGPCLLATILGTVLLYYFVYPPPFAIRLKDLMDMLQDGLVFFGGLFLTLTISRRERQRREAEERIRKEEAARQQAEALAAALAEAQARTEQKHQRLRRVVDALLAMTVAVVQAPDEGAPLVEEGSPAADVVARRLAELARSILSCRSVSLSSLEPGGGAPKLLAVAGVSPEQESPWCINRHEELHQRVWPHPAFAARLQAGELVQLDLAQPPFQDWPSLEGGHMLYVAPMRIGPQLVGLLLLEHERPAEALAAEDLALLATVAKLGALIIERERLVRARTEAQANALAWREANRQMETFLSVASHELKTPLTSIMLGLQMSQRRALHLMSQVTDQAGEVNALGESLQTVLETTLRQGGRLNTLVNDLLDTSRIQAGRLAIERIPADLIAIVCAAVEEQWSLAPERTIRLHLPQCASLSVKVDAVRIGQVVTNFLTNAFRYSPEDRPVEVGIDTEQQEARVWVRDQGPGLPAAEQAHIWERFYRVPGVEVQSGSGVGMGIGLYISKIIVEHHHGQVGVQSAPGEGSTFWFSLPLEHHHPASGR